MKNTLHNRIMRRIYIAFALRIATHTVTIHTALFVLALYVFGVVVHVQRIVEALLRTPLGNMPRYLLSAFMGAEVLTLIALGTMLFVVVSLLRQVGTHFFMRAHVA